MATDLTIAKTIQQQLYRLGRVKVWSWGTHAFQGGENFLQFKVTGHKFRGYVRITLNPLDYYNIIFSKKRDLSEKSHEVNDVCFDEMVDIIDEYVEKIPAYQH